jgi:hypothetical protein
MLLWAIGGRDSGGLEPLAIRSGGAGLLAFTLRHFGMNCMKNGEGAV